MRERWGQAHAVVLATLSMIFLARVAGQFLVAAFGVTFLPAMQAWQSGLLPYPALLCAQIAILMVHAALAFQLWRGEGWLAKIRPRLGAGLKWFAVAYFTLMFARFIAVTWGDIDASWAHARIPIYFHWVLAAHIYVASRYYRGLEVVPRRRAAG